MDLNKETDRGLGIAAIMAAGKHESSNSSMPRKHVHRRHPMYQTQKLEEFFEEWQHPDEKERCQLGHELGLTPRQIKFWFQNKRTLVKAQKTRIEGITLREENRRLKIENFAAGEMIKNGLCYACKGITKEVREHILWKLRKENSQLIDKYEEINNFLGNMGISASKPISLPPSPADSSDQPKNIVAQRTGGTSLHRIRVVGSRNPIQYHKLLYQEKQLQLSHDMSPMAMAIAKATAELSSLLVSEQLWIKDDTGRRCTLHRKNYEKMFPRINHLKTSGVRFESSKVEGIVKMDATQLVEMLLDSTKRLDLFPTIITKARTLQEFKAPTQGNLKGSFHQVYEQMHVLSPLVEHRDFYFLRYCHQTGKGEWMIVETSYDISNESQEIDDHSYSWRLPSGCMVRDMSNGCSMITWVEHVEVNEKNLKHGLYRDFEFHDLAYGAERWLLTLQRMCERFAYNMMETRDLGQVLWLPEGRRNIMNLSQRMVKNFCANLTMKNKLDIHHHLPENKNVEIQFSTFTSNIGRSQSDSFIVNAATSLWLPLSCQSVFDFLRNEKMRAQWDLLSKGMSFQEIANMSYGDCAGNCISIIQPVISSGNSMLVLQESSIDHLGGIVAYAPIDIKSFDMVVNEGDTSNIPLLPSGFVISSDGHPGTIAGTSSSTSISPDGSLLTIVFQIQDCDPSSPKHVSREMLASVHDLMSSTVQSIKSALNCNP